MTVSLLAHSPRWWGELVPSMGWGKGCSQGSARGVARWLAEPLSVVECWGHVGHPAFALGSSKVAVGFFLFVSFSRIASTTPTKKQSIFKTLFLLYWVELIYKQCWDSFRWTVKGLTCTHTCIHSAYTPILTGQSHNIEQSCGFILWAGKIPWRRKEQPTPVFLVGKSHGQRTWQATVHEDRKCWTHTEREHTHTQTHHVPYLGLWRQSILNRAECTWPFHTP